MSAEKLPESQEDIDRMNRDIAEAHIVSMLDHYRRVNEGANAIIGLVNFSELDDRLVNYFFHDQGKEKPENEKFALKMLKVYSDPNMAREEGERQTKAREILLKNPIEGVNVPEVYFCDTVPVLSETLKNHLEAEGIDIEKEGVGVVLMDFVEGEDMMSYVYKDIIKQFQEVRPEQNETLLKFKPELAEVDTHLEHGDEIDFFKLEDRASLALDLKVARDSSAKREVRDENTKKIIKFLSDSGYIFDENVIERLRRAINVLHKNGLFHRDLHERNIMFTFDDAGVIETVSLIDFGMSVIVEPGETDVYHEGNKAYPDDGYVISEFSKLVKSKEEMERNQFFSKLNRMLVNVDDSKKYESEFAVLMARLEKVELTEEDLDDIKDEITDFSNMIIKDYDSEDNFNLRLSLWQKVQAAHPELSEAIAKEFSSILNSSRSLPIYKTNTLKKLIDYKYKKQTPGS